MKPADRARVLALGLAWAVLSWLPYLHATLAPPPGRYFSGSFVFQDDYFQHLSFAEQASRGAFLFENKFDLAPHEPFLVNLEWWTAGLLGRAATPVEGYEALGFLAALGAVAAAAGVLHLAGRSGAALVWGLLLFVTGGGLGWLRLALGSERFGVPDLGTVLFPAAQRAFGATHTLLATGLFLLALVLLVEAREGRRPRAAWLLTATVLGLVRPFDLVLLGLVAVALAGLDAAAGQPRLALSRALDLVWLAPIGFYAALAYLFHPAFAVWTSAQNAVARPGLVDLVLALGPATLAAAAAWRGTSGSPVATAIRTALALTALAGLALLVSPATFAYQFATLLGPVLLLLAAAGLPRPALPWLTLLIAPSSLVLLAPIVAPPQAWFPPRDYQAAVLALRAQCRDGDLFVAPAKLSLIAAGVSPCRVALGHRVLTPELETRRREEETLLAASTPAAWRREYLDRLGAAFVALPPGLGPSLGGAWEPALVTASLEVWRRRR